MKTKPTTWLILLAILAAPLVWLNIHFAQIDSGVADYDFEAHKAPKKPAPAAPVISEDVKTMGREISKGAKWSFNAGFDGLEKLDKAGRAYFEKHRASPDPKPATSKTPNTTTKKVQSKMGTVELIDARLAPFKFATNGKMGQEVLTTWKNTGESSVRVVDAEITSLNGDGSTRETFNYPLYAEFDDSPGVIPSETHVTQAGRGFKLPGFEGSPGYSPAASVKVRITKVAEKSGM